MSDTDYCPCCGEEAPEWEAPFSCGSCGYATPGCLACGALATVDDRWCPAHVTRSDNAAWEIIAKLRDEMPEGTMSNPEGDDWWEGYAAGLESVARMLSALPSSAWQAEDGTCRACGGERFA